MTEWRLCIDFGTAYSKAAAAPEGAWSRFEPGSVRPLLLGGRDAGNAFLLDSAVFIDDDRILFGRAAVARANALAEQKRMALRSFKTLLSVSDLDRALNTNAPVSIDPHRAFQMRDLIVLYLAYLLSAIDRAVAEDPVLADAQAIALRYAAPAWRRGDSAGAHGAIVRLFGEAEALREALGLRLLSPHGVSLGAVSETLPAAFASPRPYLMGLIFEATAAAAYTSIGLEDSASHLIVLDMGAGTTDVAAVARMGGRMEELDEARVTLKQAGDFIDRVIANIVVKSSPKAKTEAQRAELWRSLMSNMQDIKESLFLDRKAVLRQNNRTLSITLRDLERDRDFRDFLRELTEAYELGLDVVCRYALARGRREIQAIAVGGGASAPFIQELIRRKPRNAKVRVEPRPATPEWAFAPEFRGNLAPVFPQLAIAIGGALAPETVLAAQGLSPAAAGRSDIRAGRD
jgi:molecular chaperone DnaK (HSP70)